MTSIQPTTSGHTDKSSSPPNDARTTAERRDAERRAWLRAQAISLGTHRPN